MVPGVWLMGMASASNLFPPAHSYLNARLWAAPAVLFIVVSEGAFRGYGNTRIPLLASAAAAIINLVLDPVMMFPMVGMGVVSAAAATPLSQLGAAAVYGIFLRRNKMLPQPKHHVIVYSESTKSDSNDIGSQCGNDDQTRVATFGMGVCDFQGNNSSLPHG